MSNDSLTYYLGTRKSGVAYTLLTDIPKDDTPMHLKIDFADRSIQNNSDYFPWPIIKDSINMQDGLVFMSDPFENETIINGSFSGELKIISNKKDFDFSVNLYELTPEGNYFHLSYYIGRASYCNDREQRELLIKNKEVTLSFYKTRIVSKELSKGSQLVVIINGNKNPYSQINYGTGKEVSSESLIDSTEPLELTISSKSNIVIPIWKEL